LDTTRQSALRKLVLMTDAVIVAASAVVAFFVHAALHDLTPLVKGTPAFDQYFLVVVLAWPVWLGLVAAFGLHRVLERMWTRRELLVGLAKLHAAGMLALSAILFLSRGVINRSLVAVFLGCSFTLLYTERAILARWLRYQHDRGQARERLLLVGDPSPELDRFVRAARSAALPPMLVGVVGATHEATEGAPRHLGALEDLPTVLHEEAVDRVLFFPPHGDPRRALSAIEQCETQGVPAAFALDLSPSRHAVPTIERIHGGSFVHFEVAPKPPLAIAVKHAFDAIASAIGLVVLAPVFLVTALAILVTMGRPVFFSQGRAGLRGRPFRMFKFRTMVADAEERREELGAANEMSGPVFKLRNDPRVTRLGAFLRTSSIDELPQLLNVFLGTMSLVGPRPLPVREQRQIRGWHRRRLSMKPGITCLWQIGGRNDVDFEDWMRLDLEYVDRWSLGLDAAILLRTLPVVLGRRGAR
jgi:exopolysaccharide biosynthesis polyprenyl glycosylphosphotransferase